VILLDDDNNDQNDAISGPDADEPYPYPAPGLSVDNTVRGGDTITGLTGVLHWSWSGVQDTDAWRLRPIAGKSYTFARANPRTAEPEDVGGRLRVASFNVLNYFTTLDETPSTSSGPCGPTGGADCRGADSAAELERQRAKIVAALTAIDPHIAGLIEIQNDAGAATADLVAALNTATAPGTYAFVETGTIGSDAIKQAFVYQPAAVRPVGEGGVLTSAGRPALRRHGQPARAGADLRRGGDGRAGDRGRQPLQVQGLPPCAGDRTRGRAGQLQRDAHAGGPRARLTPGDGPPAGADTDVLVIGDLNSYRNEDPIRALEAAGYTDLVERFGGEDAYGYLFDGQLGYLDHALANASLLRQVTGATEWHINADEVPLLDYNDAVHDAPGEAPFERESSARPLYAADPYRSSDHDPVVDRLDLDSTGPALCRSTRRTARAPGPERVPGRHLRRAARAGQHRSAERTVRRVSGAAEVAGSTLTVDPARKLPGRPGTTSSPSRCGRARQRRDGHVDVRRAPGQRPTPAGSRPSTTAPPLPGTAGAARALCSS
jgi:hypothetical protein